MKKIQHLFVLILIASIISACNLPSGAPTESPVPEAGDGSPSPTATETVTPITTGVPATACTPQIVTNTDSNVRGGPGQVYGILGQLTQSSTAIVDGKSSDGTWWYIQFPAGPNGHGWIAGSITTATCIPDTLAIIAAPPTPIPPSNTPTFTPTNTPTATSTSGLIIVIPPIFIIPSSTPTPIIFQLPTLNFPFPNP